MAYVSKEWKDIDAEYPNRYTATKSDLTSEVLTMTNNFGTITEPGDVFDASTMNNLERRIASAFSDDADAIEDASGLNFAEEYDDTATYTVNDYCVHEGLLYKCITAISTAEAWTPAHWSRVYVTDEIAGASSLQGLSDVNISSPTNGQALVYDSSSSKWVNGAGGGSSASGVYIGTCSTAGNQAQKEVTVSADQGFVLEKGATICVKFSANNTATDVTISVNNGTAYPIYYASGVYSASWNIVNGRNGYYTTYTFDGNYWVWVSHSNYPSYSSMTDAEAEAGTSTNDRLIKPTVLKNAIDYHAPSAVRTELTQAQYDQLSSAEKNNGTIYFITDAPSNPVDYSTSEKVIGHWIDGSTLYERTFDFNLDDMAGGTQSATAINGRFDLPHIDYDALWIEQAFILNDVPDNTLTIKSLPLPTIQNNNGYIRVQIQQTSSNDGYPFIYVDVQWSISQLHSKKADIHYVFVVRYTK